MAEFALSAETEDPGKFSDTDLFTNRSSGLNAYQATAATIRPTPIHTFFFIRVLLFDGSLLSSRCGLVRTAACLLHRIKRSDKNELTKSFRSFTPAIIHIHAA